MTVQQAQNVTIKNMCRKSASYNRRQLQCNEAACRPSRRGSNESSEMQHRSCQSFSCCL